MHKSANEENAKRENANVDGDGPMGTMLHFGSTVSREFAKAYLMDAKYARAHDEGYIHIHDLDFWAMGTTTCTQIDLNKLKRECNKIILTPHWKEFERISKIPTKEIEKDPITYAQNFAKQYQVLLLLKGPTTIVTDGQKVYLVKRGCPGMATAGSGDVLSGVLLGLLGYLESNLLTVATGAYLAGIAGEMAQEKNTDIGMIASDTVQAIPEAIKQIRNN